MKYCNELGKNKLLKKKPTTLNLLDIISCSNVTLQFKIENPKNSRFFLKQILLAYYWDI